MWNLDHPCPSLFIHCRDFGCIRNLARTWTAFLCQVHPHHFRVCIMLILHNVHTVAVEYKQKSNASEENHYKSEDIQIHVVSSCFLWRERFPRSSYQCDIRDLSKRLNVSAMLHKNEVTINSLYFRSALLYGYTHCKGGEVEITVNALTRCWPKSRNK
jgi:hypothetical protein